MTLPNRPKKTPRLRLQGSPATATLTASVEPAEDKSGDTVSVKVTAKLDDGYHIYKYSKEKGSGPVPTSFDFFDPAGLAIEGDWSASREPEKNKDTNFPDVDSGEYYEGEVTWSIKLKIPASAAAGKKTLRCQAMYMVCDAKTCSIPGRWTLPDIELTVAPDKAPQPAAAQPAAKAAVTAKTPAPAASATDPKPQYPPPSEPAQPEKTAEKSAPAAGVESEIAQKAQAGLIPFLIASAIGGLFALVMPCVWPMVPITVNFFIKQGQGPAGRKKATGLAITYCLSIIAVFTAVGVHFLVLLFGRLRSSRWREQPVAEPGRGCPLRRSSASACSAFLSSSLCPAFF